MYWKYSDLHTKWAKEMLKQLINEPISPFLSFPVNTLFPWDRFEFLMLSWVSGVLFPQME